MQESIIVGALGTLIGLPIAIWLKAPWYATMALTFAGTALVRAAYV